MNSNMKRPNVPITLPVIEELPHIMFTPHWPMEFMGVSYDGVSISRSNLVHYLERPEEFFRTLNKSIELMDKLKEGSTVFAKQRYVNRLYHIEPGLMLPTSSAPWDIRTRSVEYLTVISRDVNVPKSEAVRHYISIDVHDRLLLEAKREISHLVSDAVEKGVSRGLTDIYDEKEKLLAQRSEIERKLAKLEAAEAKLQAREAAKANREPRSTAGYVYLLNEVNGDHYKIGRTRNPENRLQTFNVKLPYRVEYAHLIETDDMYTLEATLHARFSHCRVDGEWFALTPFDVQYIQSL